MLPFLKKIKNQSGIAIQNRPPDEPEQDHPDAGIEACMSNLIDAMHSKDIKRAVEAYKDLKECDYEPESNEEGMNEAE